MSNSSKDKEKDNDSKKSDDLELDKEKNNNKKGKKRGQKIEIVERKSKDLQEMDEKIKNAEKEIPLNSDNNDFKNKGEKSKNKGEAKKSKRTQAFKEEKKVRKKLMDVDDDFNKLRMENEGRGPELAGTMSGKFGTKTVVHGDQTFDLGFKGKHIVKGSDLGIKVGTGEVYLNEVKPSSTALSTVDVEYVSEGTNLSDNTDLNYKIHPVTRSKPEIPIGTLSDIPVLFKFEQLSAYRYKYTRNDVFKAKESWLDSVENFIEGWLSLGIDMANRYDFVLVDDPNRLNYLSTRTSKRPVEHLNLNGDQNKDPASIVKSLLNYEFDPEAIEQAFFDDFNIRKSLQGNVRENIAYRLDDFSYDMLIRYSRGAGDMLVLPPDFIRGWAPYQDMFNYIKATSSMAMVLVEPDPKFHNEMFNNRSFFRPVIVSSRFTDLIMRYTCFFEYYNNILKNVWVTPFLDTIRIEYVPYNPLLTYFSKTPIGLSQFRQTSARDLIMGYNTTKAAQFIPILINYLTDPYGYLVLEDYTNLSPSWYMEAMMFMYIFKPHVCSTEFCTLMLRKIFLSIATMNDFRITNTMTLTDAKNIVSRALGPIGQALIQEWTNYAIGLNVGYDLYSNDGNLTPVADTSGMFFWGRKSIDPWRFNLTEDATWLSEMVNIFNASQEATTAFIGWAAEFKKVFGIAVTHSEQGVFSTLKNVIINFRYVANTIGFINRVECPKVNQHVLPVQSLFSFIIGAECKAIKSFEFSSASLLNMLYLDDYWMSKFCCVMDKVMKVDLMITNYTGYANAMQSPSYLKLWNQFLLAAKSIEGDHVVKDLFARDPKSDFSATYVLNLGAKLDSTYDDFEKTFLPKLLEVYSHDWSLTHNSRFLVVEKVFADLLNTDEWYKFGINSWFCIGNPVTEVVPGLDIRKVAIKTVVNTINYRENILKFGTIPFYDMLTSQYFNGIKFLAPTFYEFIRVKPNDGFTDSAVDPSGQWSFGGKEIIKWFKEPKHSTLPKVDEGKLFTFKVRVQWMPAEEREYNDRLKVHYCPSAYTEPFYFLYPGVFDDSYAALTSPIRYCSGLLETLKDDTHSVYESYPKGHTEYLIKFTFTSLGDVRR